MRGAWGKPYGIVARVNIGQQLMSVRTKESNRAIAIEALRRSRYKFPGSQKIVVSRNWGFTPLEKDEYREKRAKGELRPDGAYVKFLGPRGKLEENVKNYPVAFGLPEDQPEEMVEAS